VTASKDWDTKSMTCKTNDSGSLTCNIAQKLKSENAYTCTYDAAASQMTCSVIPK
jgi:hypothetical protein